MTRWELEIAHPPVPVRSLADLPETERVWTGGVQFGELVHRRASLKVAVCGAAILEWGVAAGHLAVLGGRLCPACWPIETPAGPNPAGDMEGTV